jgi:hypothetical protein
MMSITIPFKSKVTLIRVTATIVKFVVTVTLLFFMYIGYLFELFYLPKKKRKKKRAFYPWYYLEVKSYG